MHYEQNNQHTGLHYSFNHPAPYNFHLPDGLYQPLLTVTAISEHVLKGELEGTGTPGSWTGSEDGMNMEDPATEPTGIEILIDDIVLVEEEKIGAVKTTLAVGVGILTIAMIAFTIVTVSFATSDWSSN